MFNEFICIFRRYCELSQEDVANAARIPLEKYKEYEYGLNDPDSETLRRLAAVFGLKESVFNLGIEPMQKTLEMFEPKAPDENIFKTPEDRASVRLLVNMLTKDESRLLLLYRTASRKQKNKIMKTAMQSLSCMDAVTEAEIDEYLLSLEGTYAHGAEKLAEEYDTTYEEANMKLKKLFSNDSWIKIKSEIMDTVDNMLKNIVKEEFSKQ